MKACWPEGYISRPARESGDIYCHQDGGEEVEDAPLTAGDLLVSAQWHSIQVVNSKFIRPRALFLNRQQNCQAAPIHRQTA